VDARRRAVLGLRNLDENEDGFMRQSGVHACTMKNIDCRDI
jgi:arginase family enzyme